MVQESLHIAFLHHIKGVIHVSLPHFGSHRCCGQSQFFLVSRVSSKNSMYRLATMADTGEPMTAFFLFIESSSLAVVARSTSERLSGDSRPD